MITDVPAYRFESSRLTTFFSSPSASLVASSMIFPARSKALFMAVSLRWAYLPSGQEVSLRLRKLWALEEVGPKIIAERGGFFVDAGKVNNLSSVILLKKFGNIPY